ncbi:hypothetical protein [Streptomyces demainii]|uniref:Uncharacterized protein n=1 Tax=Streptomyces demainii TaxID=588122 RepID=A0ABT9L6Z5_9ACTN|nr:hypothetical protein [Streptomyces demainii]MDP9616495.1 hypothetical protein [Streptomyces demainii]
MRSLLALLHTSEPAAAQARTEIGPPPADGYRALLDPHRLLEHLSFHAPHEDRPIGLDPDQLATVRQQICQGMAAVTLAHMRNHLAHRPDTNADFKDMVRSAVRRMNSFPDPDSGLADQTGPGDHLLPDPPIRYTVSFHTCDDVDQVSLIYSTAEPGPAHLNLLVPADWGPTIATPGQAVLAGRPVTGVLHRDQNGRPTTVWVVEVEEVRPTPSGDRTVWHLAARSKLADVDWSSGRPRLFTPEPADSP